MRAKPTKREALAIAKKCEDAYSFDSYSPGGWRQCAVMLTKRGYDSMGIEAILRSKWTRWACDSCDKHRYGRHNSRCLAAFLDGKPDQITPANWKRRMGP